MISCETSRGVEFQKRAVALSVAIKDPVQRSSRELVDAVKRYLTFLSDMRESPESGGVGPGAAAEINFILWGTFPLLDVTGSETGDGLHRLLVDLSALSVRELRLYPPRPESRGSQLTYYQDWRVLRKPSDKSFRDEDFRDEEVLFDTASSALMQGDLFGVEDIESKSSVLALEATAELLLAVAQVVQFLGYTANLALQELTSSLGPGKTAERAKLLNPKHYLCFQVLALPDNDRPPFSPSILDKSPSSGSRKGTRIPANPPQPEDPTSIWAAIRRWCVADSLCDHLFRNVWGWLADHKYSQLDPAVKQWQQERARMADPFIAKLVKAWEKRSAIPAGLLCENPDWLNDVPAHPSDDSSGDSEEDDIDSSDDADEIEEDDDE